MTFRELLHLIHSDILRFADQDKLKVTFLRKISIILLPCVASIALYRISHYFWKNKHFVMSRLFWMTNLVLFSIDLVPFSEIGPSLYMPHTVGIALMAKIGRNATIYGQVGIAGRKEKDVGAGPGTPVIGDNVVIGFAAKIVGPVRIGNNVTIAPGSLVFKGAPDGSLLYGSPARIIKTKSEMELIHESEQ